MGIPSFYKHLIQTIDGLTSKTREPPKVFALDLNCAIYYCVRKVQNRFPYNHDVRIKWEKDLIDAVIAYIQKMEKIVNPTSTLYIAVDGVAPMAKIKQQRLRRFKSAVQAEDEARIRGIDTVRWDTNAITPGTAFMEKLTNSLREFAKTNKKIIVSPADEPGEGEQKIMAWIREYKPSDVVVYGLDADLIILSLWCYATLGTKVDLFREEMEFNGTVKEDSFGDVQFLFLNMEQLAMTLIHKFTNKHSPAHTPRRFLTDFVALMNLLGNDFVPHGLSLKIRDNGIEHLLELYKDQHEPLLKEPTDDEGWQYDVVGLRVLFQHLAKDEPAALLKTFTKKLGELRIGMGKTQIEQDLAAYNDQPVKWAVERCIVDSVRVAGFDKPKLQLKSDWQRIYDRSALLGCDAVKVYLESLAWTLAYYSGEPVDTEWYYPWYLPPRMDEIRRLLETQNSLPVPNTVRPVLRPLEQLAMVLPESSYDLLPSHYKTVLTKYQYAFPKAWDLFSFGRRFLWECEPMIPLLAPEQVKLFESPL